MLEDGVDGLVHISQIADRHVVKPEDELTVGDMISVKIIDINETEHKISLSKREADLDLAYDDDYDDYYDDDHDEYHEEDKEKKEKINEEPKEPQEPKSQDENIEQDKNEGQEDNEKQDADEKAADAADNNSKEETTE